MKKNKKMGKNNKRIKRKQNNADRFAAILFVAMLVNLSLYLLPENLGEVKIKKVDLFSDIRIDKGDGINNLLISGERVEDIPFFADIQKNKDENPAVNQPDSATKTVMSFTGDAEKTSPDAPEINNRENEINDAGQNALSENLQFDKNDISNKHIEDFSNDHNSLHRFFAALNNINKLGRPVRIAFVGDSFIEGDIVVADFREKMQERFGGRGVGFIPVSSNVSQYRPTIKQSAKGWKTFSIINNKKQKYVLSGLLFEPKSADVSISFSTVDMYPGLKEVSSLKIIYANSENTEIELSGNGEGGESVYGLPPSSDEVMQFEIRGKFSEAEIKFRKSTGLQAFGIALEDNNGVIVDNLSLRGNSGMVMSEIDGERCRELQRIRPYDLIVLQYGLNVASDSIREYGWYRKGMTTVIQHIKSSFPGADIMLLGVSDRSHKQGGAYTTMPAVLSLLRAQRQTARDAEIAFWNIFAAMGGQNSMVQYVKTNKASKDYTHLSFKGGREIADALYDAILQEKRMYDGDERLIE
jgi:lysophospholipase L1-like esterase